MPANICDKCRHPMRARRFQCRKCKAFFCPSCTQGFCMFCKGEIREVAAAD